MTDRAIDAMSVADLGRTKPAAKFEHVETVNSSEPDSSLTTGSARHLQLSRHSTFSTGPTLSVLDVIPTSFDDVYPPEVFLSFPPQPPHQFYPSHSRPCSVGDDGLFSSFGIADLYLRRPSFTRRPLVDWEKNDLRSLCIVCELKPEWPDPPLLREESFRVVLMPLDSTDDEIASILAQSDIYLEANFSAAHRERSAKETVALCGRTSASLTKPEWRRLIDNYLLALGCEAQARLDYKTALALYVSRKQEQQLAKGQSNLLRRVLLNRAGAEGGMSGFIARTTRSSFFSKRAPDEVSVREQKQIWREVQLLLYARLGLNWEPTELAI